MQHTTRHSVCFHLFHVGLSLSYPLSVLSLFLSLLVQRSLCSSLVNCFFSFTIFPLKYVPTNIYCVISAKTSLVDSECLIYMQYNYTICLDTMCNVTHRRDMWLLVVYMCMQCCKSEGRLYLHSFIVWFLGSVLPLPLFSLFYLYCAEWVSERARARAWARSTAKSRATFFSAPVYVALVVLCNESKSKSRHSIHIFIPIVHKNVYAE